MAQQKKSARKLKDFSDGSARMRYALMTISIIGGFFFWYLITLIPTINTFLASPKQVLQALISESKAGGRYWKDISISLQRVLIGFGLAFVASIPVAFLMGWYPKVRNLIEPWIQFMRTIPPIALIPLVILAMGLGERLSQKLEGTFDPFNLVAPSKADLKAWFADKDGAGYHYLKGLYEVAKGNVPAGNRVKSFDEAFNDTLLLKAIATL